VLGSPVRIPFSPVHKLDPSTFPPSPYPEHILALVCSFICRVTHMRLSVRPFFFCTRTLPLCLVMLIFRVSRDSRACDLIMPCSRSPPFSVDIATPFYFREECFFSRLVMSHFRYLRLLSSISIRPMAVHYRDPVLFAGDPRLDLGVSYESSMCGRCKGVFLWRIHLRCLGTKSVQFGRPPSTHYQLLSGRNPGNGRPMISPGFPLLI